MKLRSKELAHKEWLNRAINKQLAGLGVDRPTEVIAICGDRKRPMERRAKAASLIGGLGGLGRLGRFRREAADTLIAAFQEGHPDLAWHSAVSLGQLGEKRALRVLLKAASGAKDKVIRVAAISALGLLGDSRAAGVLSAIVSNRRASSLLRGNAANALVTCGRNSTRAVRSLILSLEDKSAEVRFFCAYALGFIGTSDAIQPLQERLADKEVVRGYGSVAGEAASALRQLGR